MNCSAEMGANDFIRKPFWQRLLAERVKVVLAAPRPRMAHRTKEARQQGFGTRPTTYRPGAAYLHLERLVTFTVTEFLVLQALASRPGVVRAATP